MKTLAISLFFFMSIMVGTAQAETLAKWKGAGKTNLKKKVCVNLGFTKKCVTLKVPGLKNSKISVKVTGSVKMESISVVSLKQKVKFKIFGKKLTIPLQCVAGKKAKICLNLLNLASSLRKLKKKSKNAKKVMKCIKKARALTPKKVSAEALMKCGSVPVSCETFEFPKLPFEYISKVVKVNYCTHAKLKPKKGTLKGKIWGTLKAKASLPSVKILGKKIGGGEVKKTIKVFKKKI